MNAIDQAALQAEVSRRPEEQERLLRRAVLAPLIIMAVVAIGLFATVYTLYLTDSAMRESDRLIEDTNEALRFTVEMPAAIRGYLLTGSPDFLEPAKSAPGMAIASLETLAKSPRIPPSEIEELKRNVLLYVAFMREAEATKQRGGDYAALIGSRRGKMLIDRNRQLLMSRIATEEALRSERIRVSHVISRVAVWTSTLLILTAAAVLVLFSRRNLAQATRSYQALLIREREARKLAESTAKELATARDSLEVRVSERTASLEAANRELEAFSYSVSHDLRAPIRHISGFAELLLRKGGTTLDPALARYTRTIADAAKSAGILVDDLLAFSRVGRAELRFSAVHLGNLLDEVIKESSSETEGRKVSWRVAPLPVVTGDPAMLRLVLRNLISNALKYTAREQETVVEVGTRQEEGEQVFWVRDNGVGFDMRYSDKLFGVFQRLHSTTEFEGTGIGLANVRRIVSRHGGRTWAEGAPGAGATFYFSLPDDK